MGRYALVGDVRERVPYRQVTATSSPTETTVGQWIVSAESILHATLRAVGVGVPVTDREGSYVAKRLVLDYAEGHLRKAYASSGGDGTNDDGKDLLEDFDKFMLSFKNDPATAGAIFGGGSAPESTRQLQSHTMDHPDGQTVAAGDFDPVFVKRDGADQW